MKPIEEGYTAVQFSSNTNKWLESLCANIESDKRLYSPSTVDEGVKWNYGKFHCSLMYSKSTPDSEYNMDLHNMALRIDNLRYSMLGQNEDVLVIEFDSKFLQSEFKKLSQEGEEHSFDDFRPHITLASNIRVRTDLLPELPKLLVINLDRIKSEEAKK